MAHQINLDRWQSSHLTGLLRRRSKMTERTGRPVELYRRVLEESDECYEEVVCTLANGYVIEQMVSSGGPIPPSFTHQTVYGIDEYPDLLRKKSPERFREVVAMMESSEQAAGETGRAS